MALLALALVLAATLALTFTLLGTRAISGADRAESAAAARRRFQAVYEAGLPGPDGAPVPVAVATVAFDTLLDRAAPGTPPSAVHPRARLRADLGLEPADVEDVVLLVAARCEAGRLPRGRDLDELPSRVATVEQLVAYVAGVVAREGRGLRVA